MAFLSRHLLPLLLRARLLLPRTLPAALLGHGSPGVGGGWGNGHGLLGRRDSSDVRWGKSQNEIERS